MLYVICKVSLKFNDGHLLLISFYICKFKHAIWKNTIFRGNSYFRLLKCNSEENLSRRDYVLKVVLGLGAFVLKAENSAVTFKSCFKKYINNKISKKNPNTI